LEVKKFTHTASTAGATKRKQGGTRTNSRTASKPLLKKDPPAENGFPKNEKEENEHAAWRGQSVPAI